MIQPRLSIITVCRNSADTIDRTIESIISQKGDDVEYIIIDGLSSDATLDIIKSYDGIDRVVSEPDHGIADAFNKGIRLARGEIIGLINSDDLLCAHALATVRSYFQSHPDVDVVHGDVNLLEGNRVVKRIKPPTHWWYPWRLVLFNHPATFVRRQVYERHGLFDISYRIAMDVEIYFRWMASQLRIDYVPELLASMNSGGASSQQAFRGYQEVCRAALHHGFNFFLVYLQFVVKLALWTL